MMLGSWRSASRRYSGDSKAASIAGCHLAVRRSKIPVEAAAETLTVMVFPGISNLALFAAQSQDYFGRNGLTVTLRNTVSSKELRDGLAQGSHQIAHAGVDNAVAMVDVENADAVVVVGGHGGFNRLDVQPEISSYADLRGKTLGVDSPNTAFALVLYKMLQVQGVARGEYSVALSR